MKAIPEDFIQKYVDELLKVAYRFDPGPMRDAAARRAEAVMDMVKAYRESEKR